MDTATVEALSTLIPLLKSLGLPTALVVVFAISVRKIVLWSMALFKDWGVPHIEACVKAYQTRQETMAECQKKLTNSTIEIQSENRAALLRLEQSLPMLCRHKQAQQPNQT